MKDKHSEACPESLLHEVAADLQPAVSELYRGLWRISVNRERRSNEQDRQLLASVNAAAKAIGCVGFSSLEAASFITMALATNRLGLEPPDYFADGASAAERQELATNRFTLIYAEMKRALADLSFLRACADAEPRIRAEDEQVEELRKRAPPGTQVNLRLVRRGNSTLQ
jgi:hypothetical protein